MIYKFNKVNHQPSNFVLALSNLTGQEQKIIVVGYDPERDHTSFFRREIYLKPNEQNVRYYLTAPLTSKSVNVDVFDINNENVFKSNIARYKLNVNPFNKGGSDGDYLRFILPFCYHYETMRFGTYFDKTGRFEIVNFPQIIDQNGIEVKTPSRISKSDNHIEVSSKMFIDIPIPRRVMILLHEYAHNFMNVNKDDESEADINGLKIYSSLCFPAIESMYAFTQILADSNESVMRLENIKRFYDGRKLAYTNKTDSSAMINNIFNNFSAWN